MAEPERPAPGRQPAPVPARRARQAAPPSPAPLGGRDAPSAPDASNCASCPSCKPSCVADTSARILISDSHRPQRLNNPRRLALHPRFPPSQPISPAKRALDPAGLQAQKSLKKFISTQNCGSWARHRSIKAALRMMLVHRRPVACRLGVRLAHVRAFLRVDEGEEPGFPEEIVGPNYSI